MRLLSLVTRPSLRGLVAGSGRIPEHGDFSPIKVAVVDLDEQTGANVGDLASSGSYACAWVLVRLHGRPLGELTVTTTAEPASDDELGQAIWNRWGSLIDDHVTEHRSSSGEAGGRPLAGWESCLSGQRRATPSVSVVIPTYRRLEGVLRCVESVLSTGYPDLEILVVDNAPAYPGTAAALSERFSGDERVRYLTQPVPGASRARNKGVASARGDVIAFVDDDVVVDRHWLVALIDALDRSPDAACVTGLVIPDSLDSPEQFWFEAFGGFNRGYARRTFDLANDRGDTLLYPYTAGALGALNNAAFRRSALKSPVAFDETLGPGTPAFGAEDQDSFVSLLRAGGRLVYEPSALVRHSHRDSYAELRWQIFTYGAGMVAGLLHWAMRDRSVARELTGRILAALPAILRGGYRETALQSASDACPPSLRRLERLGHVYGPVAYARAVRYRRRIDHQASTSADDARTRDVM